jgi:hypothetical protein
MAEQLKREYDIVVLKAELVDREQHGGNVKFTLQFKAHGVLQDSDTWLTTTEELGLTDRMDARSSLGEGPRIELPQSMLEDLENFVRSEAGHRPLWVHLVKPYGLLRFIPWERLLVDWLDVPILMLPDFIFPPPRETKSVLEVALCGSAPLGIEEYSVFEAVSLAVDRILAASVRRTRIHVFVDQDLANGLRSHWSESGQLNSTVMFHENAAAGKYVLEDASSRLVDRSGTIRSPWLLWMRDALRDRGVDVLHFVCHGYVSRERGAMLFAQSPLERTERYLAGPVSATELGTFLTQVGAWSTVFTSLQDNYSEPGLRALADEIAQNRPGPLMMHSMREDPGASMLDAGYRFLYGFQPEQPPISKALFIYCQPYRTADAMRSRHRGVFAKDFARNAAQREAADRAKDESPLEHLFKGSENVSRLVASTERFVEQVHLRDQQLARDELVPTERRERDMHIVQDTIEKIREAVAQVTAAENPPAMNENTEVDA